MAEYSPATATSGEVIEPRTNRNTPISADALPVIYPCDSRAKSKEEVVIIPIEQTKEKIEIALLEVVLETE